MYSGLGPIDLDWDRTVTFATHNYKLNYIYFDRQKRETSALVSEGKVNSLLVHLHRSGFSVDDHLQKEQ